MTAKITSFDTKQLTIQEYKIVFEIAFNSEKYQKLQTPGFFPLSDVDVKFCFEILYQSIKVPTVNEEEYVLFKLALIKLFGSGLTSSLNMDIDVSVTYSDGSLFQKWETLPSVNAQRMDIISFKDVVFPLTDLNLFGKSMKSEHFQKMLGKCLTVKCNLKFYDYVTPLGLYQQESQSLDNLRQFNRESSHVYRSFFTSDIVFQIGDKTIPAHKSILIAHSPIFLKMATNGTLESLNNCILISDVPYDVFDCFLKYLYSGEIEDKSFPTVTELYTLASKYEIQTLKRECSGIVVSYLNLDRVCEILKLAYINGDESLKRKSKEFAANHIQDLISKDEWKELIASDLAIGYEVTVNCILKGE
nr:TD and POZ domain-containing protein 3 [Parasteatoda tepidariorum]